MKRARRGLPLKQLAASKGSTEAQKTGGSRIRIIRGVHIRVAELKLDTGTLYGNVPP